MKQEIGLIINGEDIVLEVNPYETLAECLREKLGLIGVRVSCNRGDCGACTVLLDDEPVCSCMILAIEAHGRNVVSIEGLARNGELHPIQDAFIEGHGMQCGFCTPGMILNAKALLDADPSPSEEDVREAISGNLCRCGTYPKIVKSILAAADVMRAV